MINADQLIPVVSFLSFKGDWHQYDDIICAETPKSMIERVKDFGRKFLSEQKSLIKGREIAGKIMLETIFDLLRDWTDINLRNFMSQLHQFFQVYSEPFVYEEKEKKWNSLNYGPDDVSLSTLCAKSRCA